MCILVATLIEPLVEPLRPAVFASPSFLEDRADLSPTLPRIEPQTSHGIGPLEIVGFPKASFQGSVIRNFLGALFGGC